MRTLAAVAPESVEREGGREGGRGQSLSLYTYIYIYNLSLSLSLSLYIYIYIYIAISLSRARALFLALLNSLESISKLELLPESKKQKNKNKRT